jgi:hypothetical protein
MKCYQKQQLAGAMLAAAWPLLPAGSELQQL